MVSLPTHCIIALLLGRIAKCPTFYESSRISAPSPSPQKEATGTQETKSPVFQYDQPYVLSIPESNAVIERVFSEMTTKWGLR